VGVNWSARENLHITLVYIGEPAQTVHEITPKLAAMSMTPLELTLSGVGTFDLQNGYSALYVGVEMTEGLRLLQHRCAAALSELTQGSTSRTYEPHITVGLIKTSEISAVDHWRLRNLHFKGQIQVSNFYLFSSKRSGETVVMERLWQCGTLNTQDRCDS
jgi:2'-5' RNA ligase